MFSALQFMEQIAQGMDYLHARGMLHRDLKSKSMKTVFFDQYVKLTYFRCAVERKYGHQNSRFRIVMLQDA